MYFEYLTLLLSYIWVSSNCINTTPHSPVFTTEQSHNGKIGFSATQTVYSRFIPRKLKAVSKQWWVQTMRLRKKLVRYLEKRLFPALLPNELLHRSPSQFVPLTLLLLQLRQLLRWDKLCLVQLVLYQSWSSPAILGIPNKLCKKRSKWDEIRDGWFDPYCLKQRGLAAPFLVDYVELLTGKAEAGGLDFMD